MGGHSRTIIVVAALILMLSSTIVSYTYLSDGSKPNYGEQFDYDGLHYMVTSSDYVMLMGPAQDGQTGGELKLSSTVYDGTGKEFIVSMIDGESFGGRTYTNSLVIPGTIETIGTGAFSRSVFGGPLVLQYGVQSIGEAAFRWTTFTGGLTLPDSVTSISKNAFQEAVFSGSLSLSRFIKDIPEGAFIGCSGLTGELVLPEHLNTIGMNAFNGCGFTGSLIIPDSVNNVGKNAFSKCHFDGSLKLSRNLTTLNEGLFYGCGFTGTLEIPDGVTEISKSAFYSNHFTGSVKIPDGVTRIGSNAFTDNDFTGSLIIPDSVNNIGPYAFDRCGFTAMTIGKRVTGINENTFVNWNLRGSDGQPILYDKLPGHTFTGTPDNMVAHNGEVWVVSFDDGQSSWSALVDKNGEALQQPESPTRDGFLFKGWQVDGKIVSWPFEVTDNTVFRAVWEPEPEPPVPSGSDGISPMIAVLAGAICLMAGIGIGIFIRR